MKTQHEIETRLRSLKQQKEENEALEKKQPHGCHWPRTAALQNEIAVLQWVLSDES